jgi:hypothetical protein
MEGRPPWRSIFFRVMYQTSGTSLLRENRVLFEVQKPTESKASFAALRRARSLCDKAVLRQQLRPRRRLGLAESGRGRFPNFGILG